MTIWTYNTQKIATIPETFELGSPGIRVLFAEKMGMKQAIEALRSCTLLCMR